MKVRYILISLSFIFLTALIITDAVYNEANSHTSGASAMRTGSPGDGGATCKNCHAGPTPTTEAGLITSNIPVDGYTGGQTYTITATIARAGHTKWGFEISPQNVAGTQLGTLIVTNTTEMQLVGSGKYITHKTAGVSGTNSRTWIFNWTAPAAGTGAVTFYGAFNITNNMNNSSGDTTVLSTLTVQECVPPAQPGHITGPIVICPNAGLLTYTISPVAGASGYNWSFPAGWAQVGGGNGDSVVVQSGTSAGSISVSAINSCGISPLSSISVTFDNLNASATSTNVNCNGQSTGTATVLPVAGVSPYTFSWGNGGTTSTITGLAAGSYFVVVTDASGCTAAASAVVTEPSPLALNTSTTSSHCGQSNGTASVQVTGGTGPYSYSWNTNPIQTTSTASNIASGNYTVTISDAHGCTSSSQAIVTDIPGPVATAVVNADVSCHDGNDGEAQVNVTGGTGPFTYHWLPAGGNSQIATGLHAGNYNVTVTDVNGCTAVSNATVNEPIAIQLSTGSTDAACTQADGNAFVVASGGAGGYSFEWNSNPVQFNDTAFNLPAGNYFVTVTDASGCTQIASADVNNTSGPVLAAGTTHDATCFGDNDGSLSVVVTSGNGPFTYQWLPSGGTDTLAQNLHAGTYSVLVTDVAGCISVLTGVVDEPELLIANAGADVSLCFGENTVLGGAPVATGGTGPYTYLWSPAGELSSATDSTPVATPAANRTYECVVTDSHGCTASSSVDVTVNPLPTAPTISVTTDSLFSSAAFAYQWYVDGNIINGFTSQLCIPFQNGNYTVVITDVNGCTATSAGYQYNSTAINISSGELHFEFYPNPAQNEITFNFQMRAEGVLIIQNLTGETLMYKKISEMKQVVNLNTLAPSVYIFQIISGDKIFRGRFIKQ